MSQPFFSRSFFDTPEEIFTTGHVYHCGQTIGMIVADNLTIARKAAKAVKITYKNHKSLILVSVGLTASALDLQYAMLPPSDK